MGSVLKLSARKCLQITGVVSFQMEICFLPESVHSLLHNEVRRRRRNSEREKKRKILIFSLGRVSLLEVFCPKVSTQFLFGERNEKHQQLSGENVRKNIFLLKISLASCCWKAIHPCFLFCYLTRHSWLRRGASSRRALRRLAALRNGPL